MLKKILHLLEIKLWLRLTVGRGNLQCFIKNGVNYYWNEKFKNKMFVTSKNIFQGKIMVLGKKT